MKFSNGIFGIGGDRLSTNVEDVRGIWPDDDTFEFVLSDWLDEVRAKSPNYALYAAADQEMSSYLLAKVVKRTRELFELQYKGYGTLSTAAKPVEFRTVLTQ